MEIFNALKRWFNLHDTEGLTHVVDGKVKVNRVIRAEEAYTIAKYNIRKEQGELVSAFMDSTMFLIERKYNNNEYCCMVEIQDDIVELAPKLMDYFRNKLGYQVVYMDDKTKIENDGFDESLTSEIPKGSAFMAIFWKDVRMRSILEDAHKSLADVVEEVMTDDKRPTRPDGFAWKDI